MLIKYPAESETEERMLNMYLWVFVLLLLLLWNVVMFFTSTLGVWIHVLPVLAIIVALIGIARRARRRARVGKV